MNKNHTTIDQAQKHKLLLIEIKIKMDLEWNNNKLDKKRDEMI